jgi:hypothetical protein
MEVNISKSKFFAEQLDIQPIRNKVEAILNIKEPITREEETTIVFS